MRIKRHTKQMVQSFIKKIQAMRGWELLYVDHDLQFWIKEDKCKSRLINTLYKIRYKLYLMRHKGCYRK